MTICELTTLGNPWETPGRGVDGRAAESQLGGRRGMDQRQAYGGGPRGDAPAEPQRVKGLSENQRSQLLVTSRPTGK